ncbi:MAG: hypothetical protein Fur002_21700 [Anaerolineales bacterium]
MYVLQILSEGGEGPNTELVSLLYAGMVFFFVVIAAGWLSSARKRPEAPVKAQHPEASEPKSAKKTTRKK